MDTKALLDEEQINVGEHKGKPELLIISPILPITSQGGSCARICNFIKYLSRDFVVHLLIITNVPLDEVKDQLLEGHTDSMHIMQWKLPSPLQRSCNFAKNLIKGIPFNFSSEFLREIKEYVQKNYHPDLVIANKIIMAALFVDSGLMRVFKDVPLILEEGALHYISYLRDAQFEKSLVKRVVGYMRYLRLKKFSRKMVKYFKRMTVIIKDEEEMLSEFCPEDKILLVSQGVDIPPEKQHHSPNNLVILGPYNYAPNRHALMWFFENVFPLLDKKGFEGHVLVIGKNPPLEISTLAQKDKRVAVTGFVEDLNEIFDKADIILCPMWKGGGLRSKIIEGMSFGKVVVTTSIGCEGIEAEDEKEILIRDTPEDFAEAIMTMLNDPMKAQSIGTTARRCIEEKYQWGKILAPLAQELQGLVHR